MICKCICGKTIQVPDDIGEKDFKCPTCKTLQSYVKPSLSNSEYKAPNKIGLFNRIKNEMKMVKRLLWR